MSALLELAERVEAATGPSHELDLAIVDACYTHGIGGVNYDPALWVERYGGHSGSLDAAMTLVPEGWEYIIVSDDAVSVYRRRASGGGYESIHTADIQPPKGREALALCAAALRAHASGETE